MCRLAHPAAAFAAAGGGSRSETKPPRADREQGVGAHQRAAQRLIALPWLHALRALHARRLGRPGGAVLDADPEPQQPRLSLVPFSTDPLDREANGGRDRPPRAHQPAAELARGRPQLLDLAPAGELERDHPLAVPRQIRQRDPAHFQLALEPLVPCDLELAAGAADLEELDRPKLVADRLLDGAVLELEAADLEVDGGARRERLDEALRLHLPRLRAARLGIAARGDDAELEAHPVLRRGGAVGVEHVALVEDGIGDLLGEGEAAGGHDGTSDFAAAGTTAAVASPAAPAASRSAARASSQVGSARSALKRCRASRLSRRRRIQAAPGK